VTVTALADGRELSSENGPLQLPPLSKAAEALLRTRKNGAPPLVQVYTLKFPLSSTPATQAALLTEMSPRYIDCRVVGSPGTMLRHCMFTASHCSMEVMPVASSRRKTSVAPPVGEEVVYCTVVVGDRTVVLK
jgi:hypothetical protein